MDVPIDRDLSARFFPQRLWPKVVGQRCLDMLRSSRDAQAVPFVASCDVRKALRATVLVASDRSVRSRSNFDAKAAEGLFSSARPWLRRKTAAMALRTAGTGSRRNLKSTCCG